MARPPVNILVIVIDCIFRHEYFQYMHHTQRYVRVWGEGGALGERVWVGGRGGGVGALVGVDAWDVCAGRRCVFLWGGAPSNF